MEGRPARAANCSLSAHAPSLRRRATLHRRKKRPAGRSGSSTRRQYMSSPPAARYGTRHMQNPPPTLPSSSLRRCFLRTSARAAFLRRRAGQTCSATRRAALALHRSHTLHVAGRAAAAAMDMRALGVAGWMQHPQHRMLAFGGAPAAARGHPLIQLCGPQGWC